MPADPEVVQTGDGKLVDLIRLFEGDKAGVQALVLRDQDHMVPLQEVFFCNERHDVLRIPREGAGSHGIDLESRLGAVDRLTAVCRKAMVLPVVSIWARACPASFPER